MLHYIGIGHSCPCGDPVSTSVSQACNMNQLLPVMDYGRGPMIYNYSDPSERLPSDCDAAKSCCACVCMSISLGCKGSRDMPMPHAIHRRRLGRHCSSSCCSRQ